MLDISWPNNSRFILDSVWNQVWKRMLTQLLALDIKQEHDLKDGQFRHIGSGAIKVVMGVGADLETEQWAYTNQSMMNKV